MDVNPTAAGSDEEVGIRYGKGSKTDVRPGGKITFEGKFDRVALPGATLIECKLIME